MAFGCTQIEAWGQKQITSGVLGILVVLVVISLTRNLIGYSSWLLHTNETTEKAVAEREKTDSARTGEARRQKKLGARELEAKLVAAQVVRAESQVRCEPSELGWDYVCSHSPMPTQSTTRLQFGISVNADRWLAASPEVPIGTHVPRPVRR